MIIYGEDFRVRKTKDKEWSFYHFKTGANIYKHYLKTEAISKAKEILREQGQENTLKAIKELKLKAIKNRVFLRPCIKRLFKNTFGFDAPRDYLMYLLSGEYCLDVIAFDKKIQTPKGTSCKDYVLNKYGARALKLVNILM